MKNEKEILKAPRVKRHITFPEEGRRLSKSSQKHHSSVPLEGHQSKKEKKKNLESTLPSYINLFRSNLKTFNRMSFDHQVFQSTEKCLIRRSPGKHSPHTSTLLSLTNLFINVPALRTDPASDVCAVIATGPYTGGCGRAVHP